MTDAGDNGEDHVKADNDGDCKDNVKGSLLYPDDLARFLSLLLSDEEEDEQIILRNARRLALRASILV